MGTCSTCLAGCCRRFNVNITGYDIVRVSHSLGISPSVFLDISEISDEDYMHNLSGKEALFVFTDNDCKRRYVINLKKLASGIFKDVKKCFFLQEWEVEDSNNPIVVKCGIYSIRPLICMVYPAKFVNNNNTAVVPYVFERYKNKENTPYAICKTSFTEADFGMNKDEIINILIKMEYETIFFNDFAVKWNRNPSSIAEFFEELPKLYENRVYFETVNDNKDYRIA